MRRITSTFDHAERRRLCGLGAAIAALHLVGWGLVAIYAPSHPVLGGLGVLAYSLGLRHAFDADHIAAIDNTTRKLLGEGQRPLGVGFFFSLGHSTIVLLLSMALAITAGAVNHAVPALQVYGGVVGTGVSGAFLWAIGLLNLVVFVGIVKLAREARRGGLDEERLEASLRQRGFMCRLLGSRFGLVRKSWQAYPLGALFGLGFDTASEVGLIAVTAGVATGRIPALAVIALPLLFAAGMSAMDTADGVFMSKAYGWAFSSPARKLGYNLTVTGLSVAVSLLVGSVELLQLLGHQLRLSGGFWSWLAAIDFSTLGYAIVALFVFVLLVALAAWQGQRFAARRRALLRPKLAGQAPEV
jgi:high-affinity nickel-transport protein